ncbi:MAG: leucyl aminopeptidase [Gammaproteobacteria bacterium]|nr:leucyl aminopeptidase [Gammaproteobacteria bacterium]
MKFKVKTAAPETQDTACVIVGIFLSNRLSAAAKRLDQACGGIISDILSGGDMGGETGDILTLYKPPNIPCQRIILVGCGSQRKFTDLTYRKIIGNSAKQLRKLGIKEAVSYLPELPLKDRDIAWKLRQAVISTVDALYTFEQTKSKKKSPRKSLEQLVLMVARKQDSAPGKQAVNEGVAIAAGQSLAKDLGNLPGNLCTPGYLAEQAGALAKKHHKLRVSVMDEDEMQKLGMGALLSVSRGSAQPAKLITLEYKGAPKTAKPIVLVGKGITFDTGGISMKPAPAMDEMKFDMCGAASVLGTVLACARMKLPIHLVGIIASAENMPGSRATKPGDIVTTMSGKTVEILNTDAEGRLVLCDALTYVERFKPSAVIDIATLTGACIIALGHHPSGLLSNDETLSKTLLTAGKNSGDQAWQLPLWDEYQNQLDSNFADMANIGGRSAGTITAGCFLSRFTKKYDWAHLDIAGTAWHSGKQKGATGRPVPLLIQYLMDQAPRS